MPCIRGLRITVHEVLDYLASGISEAEILNVRIPTDEAHLFRRKRPTHSGGPAGPTPLPSAPTSAGGRVVDLEYWIE